MLIKKKKKKSIIYGYQFLKMKTSVKQEGHDGPGLLTSESFSPQMNSTSLFLWFPTCDPRGGDSFDSKGHHVNKIDKGLQGDAT